jgi:hypothetical protein|nr:hypothetical protein [Kofleriaceae bacterium]
MRTWIIAALTVVSLTACGKSKLEKALSDEADYKDKICACTDKDCSDKAYKEYKDWDKTMQDSMTEDDVKNANKDLIEKADKVEKDLRECHHKFDKE